MNVVRDVYIWSHLKSTKILKNINTLLKFLCGKGFHIHRTTVSMKCTNVSLSTFIGGNWSLSLVFAPVSGIL